MRTIDGAEVSFFTLDGKEIISGIQAVSFDHEIEYKKAERTIANGENLTLFNQEYTVTMENVDANPEWLGALFPKSVDIVGHGYRLPKGKKLPKCKRIKKKWMKKYRQEFHLTNCKII